jgi:hypothetical protein
LEGEDGIGVAVGDTIASAVEGAYVVCGDGVHSFEVGCVGDAGHSWLVFCGTHELAHFRGEFGKFGWVLGLLLLLLWLLDFG